MNDYSFTIHHPYYQNRKLPIALLHFTAGFLLLSAFLESGNAGYPRWIANIFLILGIFELIYTFFAKRMQLRAPKTGEIIRLITALAFLLYAILLVREKQLFFGICMILTAFAFLMIFFIEQRWSKPFILKVNDKGIWFPRFFKYQLFSWKDLNHVILRGNVLTLDFKNNRVVQLDINHSYNASQAADFNHFCAIQTHDYDVVK